MTRESFYMQLDVELRIKGILIRESVTQGLCGVGSIPLIEQSIGGLISGTATRIRNAHSASVSDNKCRDSWPGVSKSLK